MQNIDISSLISSPLDFIKKNNLNPAPILIGPMFSPLEKQVFSLNLARENMILWVDGGQNQFVFLEDGVNGITIGDGDSSIGPVELEYPSSKDRNDLDLALGLIPTQFPWIIGLGFNGGRMDHQLVNIGVIHRFLLNRKSPTFVWLAPHFLFVSSALASFNYHGSISLLGLESSTEVQLRGNLLYKSHQSYKLSPLSDHGLSNFAEGLFEISSPNPYFLVL